jgi:hypothetical protein|tara:strand:+ start:348 stop:689 length:342 start_codon:yes stop_codon:yes gene_type:complete
MLCPRCNNTEIKEGRSLCSLCAIEMVKLSITKETSTSMSDYEIVKHHTIRMLMDGCRECGNKDFGFDVGVKEENELKWYVAHIHCGNCHINYKEIMEVRMNEFNKNSEPTHGK